MSDRSARSQDLEQSGALAQLETTDSDDAQANAMPLAVSGIGSEIADSEDNRAPFVGLEQGEQLVAPLSVQSGESNTNLAEQLAAANQQLQDLRLAAIQQAQELNALQNILQTRTVELTARDKKVAMLQQQLAEHTAALNAIDDDMDQVSATHSSGGYSALGYVLEDMEHPGVVHRITRATTTVGRSKTNDIAIDSTSVSRYHARLLIKPEGLWIVDLQSTNGCSINGSRVLRQILSDGDAVLIGHCRYRFTAAGVTEKEIESRLTELQDDDAALCASLVAFDAEPDSHR